MKLLRLMPVNCPICKGALLNDYINLPRGATRLTKMCSSRLNHKITIRACDKDHDYINWISIPWDFGSINWYYGTGHLLLNTPAGIDYHLPFFEPDFSNFNKLRDKLKTYLVFS